VVQGKPLEAFKNGFVNLAVPVFAFSEPQPPASTSAALGGLKGPALAKTGSAAAAEEEEEGAGNVWKWTAWDKVDVQGDMTLAELIEYFDEQLGLEVVVVLGRRKLSRGAGRGRGARRPQRFGSPLTRAPLAWLPGLAALPRQVTMLSYGVSILYSFFQNKKKTKERMPMPLTKIVEVVTGKPVNAGQKYVIFEVMCSDEEGEDVDLPCIRLILD